MEFSIPLFTISLSSLVQLSNAKCGIRGRNSEKQVQSMREGRLRGLTNDWRAGVTIIYLGIIVHKYPTWGLTFFMPILNFAFSLFDSALDFCCAPLRGLRHPIAFSVNLFRFGSIAIRQSPSAGARTPVVFLALLMHIAPTHITLNASGLNGNDESQ